MTPAASRAVNGTRAVPATGRKVPPIETNFVTQDGAPAGGKAPGPELDRALQRRSRAQRDDQRVDCERGRDRTVQCTHRRWRPGSTTRQDHGKRDALPCSCAAATLANPITNGIERSMPPRRIARVWPIGGDGQQRGQHQHRPDREGCRGALDQQHAGNVHQQSDQQRTATGPLGRKPRIRRWPPGDARRAEFRRRQW